MRLIALIDMDYFFVACEELRHPEIKSRPAVVGSDPKQGEGRGVVMTANYAARKFGLRSGMPIYLAYRIKKDAIYLPVDFDYYEEMSKKVMALVKTYADKFEQVSIDEAFIDISSRAKDYDAALEQMRKLKQEVKDKIGLPCSIGISTNKLVAKMASDDAKPDGIKLVKEDEAKEFLSKKPVGDLYGVGRKMRKVLEDFGYKSVGDLAKANPVVLVERFKSYGAELYNYANGRDESEVQENWEVKSIGRERTFERDTSDRYEITKAIREMSKEVGEEMKRQGFAFKVVTIKLRYSNFEENLKSRSLTHRSVDPEEIAQVATQLFDKYAETGEELRKVGVRVSNFAKYKGQKRMAEYA
ncbi:MAG: DNA polymerase IV [Candidatus Micrarchaeota archaeon]|nr:DNA polymerase IV [Candidatus Micrarchaeota archaeon]